jgi:hypothetical protein
MTKPISRALSSKQLEVMRNLARELHDSRLTRREEVEVLVFMLKQMTTSEQRADLGMRL